MNKIIRRIIMKMLCMITCMVFFGCGSNSDAFITNVATENPKEDSTQALVDTQSVLETDKYPICVYVCGQVVSPGVYQFDSTARVCDAIEKAGGFTDDASTDYWNQAKQLEDGEMIYVPTIEEAKERGSQEESYGDDSIGGDDGKININTASKEMLTSISGIGEGRAESIIKFRSQNGKFATIDDIKNVSGIGDAIFEKIKDYITVN